MLTIYNVTGSLLHLFYLHFTIAFNILSKNVYLKKLLQCMTIVLVVKCISTNVFKIDSLGN